jgi:hypothetical protein
MNTDTRQQIETALRAFSGADLRAAAIGLLNTLGYRSEKTLDLGGSPETFFEQFDKRDRKFRQEEVDEWVKSSGAGDHRHDDRGRTENR